MMRLHRDALSSQRSRLLSRSRSHCRVVVTRLPGVSSCLLGRADDDLSPSILKYLIWLRPDETSFQAMSAVLVILSAVAREAPV